MSTSDRDVLAYDMFSADRDSNVRVFSDRMVVARKRHECIVCLGDVQPGERHRARREKNRDLGIVMTFRACAACCEAMAQSWFDGGRAIERRTWYGAEKAASSGPTEEGPF